MKTEYSSQTKPAEGIFNPEKESGKGTAELSKWIRDHKVCFEVIPLRWFFDARTQQIGFELSLYAQPSGFQAGESQEIDSYILYSHLQKIVTDAIPKEEPRLRAEILAHDFAVRMRPVTGLKKEVQLVTLIVNSGNPFRPVNDFLANSTTDIQKQLLKMGLRYRAWQEN